MKNALTDSVKMNKEYRAGELLTETLPMLFT
jgi:hypothetical protein